MHYAPEHSGNAPYTTGLARHLAAQGLAVDVVVGYPHYPEWQLHDGYRRRRRVERDGDVVVRRQRHPVPRRPTALTRLAMESVFAVKAGWQILRRPQPDVVVAVTPVLLSLVPVVLFRRIRRYKVGVLVQDLYGAALEETGLGGGLLTRLVAGLERRLLRSADGVVVIHDVFRRRLLAAGVDDQKIRTIVNWAHVEVPGDVDRAAVRTQLGWRPDDIIALHAGNMGVKQGLEGLVEAARAADRRGSRVRVVLLGDGSQREALRAAGEGIGRLDFVAPLPDGMFERALAAADVLVLHEKPGVVEMSVPSKLTSYFSAGRPVVAATHPDSGAAALMRAAEAGVVVRAGEPEALLEAIERVGGDELQAAETGRRSRAFAAERLRSRDSLHAYEAWVRELAADLHPA